MDNNQGNQRLYWALSRPLKYMGLTIDEWAVLLIGVIPGIIFLNSAKLKLGIGFSIVGIMLCYGFKKFKKLQEHFVVKSYLVAKGLLPVPSKKYPKLLNKVVGR